jgi:uncharacterized coiled-coil DUF342 family protein
VSSSLVFFLIVIIVIAARHKRERRYLEDRLTERDRLYDDRRPAVPDTRGLEREVGDLRERIRVLERIVTEANTTDARESRRIAAEIEALREPRPTVTEQE